MKVDELTENNGGIPLGAGRASSARHWCRRRCWTLISSEVHVLEENGHLCSGNPGEVLLENLPECFLGVLGFISERTLVTDKRSKGACFAERTVKPDACHHSPGICTTCASLACTK